MPTKVLMITCAFCGKRFDHNTDVNCPRCGTPPKEGETFSRSFQIEKGWEVFGCCINGQVMQAADAKAHGLIEQTNATANRWQVNNVKVYLIIKPVIETK